MVSSGVIFTEEEMEGLMNARVNAVAAKDD